ncbi:MAG TPA: glutamate mutase L, partial [Burkholderiales bacterium]|nr:glutamate mutase L [Burkholderiales bacterium]
AARRAALGAGARLVGAFAYRLTMGDIEAIRGLAPDILLLAGGTDGGNSEVVLANARRIGASDLACPIVYAGNRDVVEEVCAALGEKTVIVTANVMPEFNVLEIEPARAAIRQVFIDRIVHAKGIDRAAAEFDAVLMPTPAAVLEGARLVADGIEGRSGLGTVMVIDPGGATTDVHSVAAGAPAPGVVPQGLPEPRVKRTVEGDLGMRRNAAAIVEAAGLQWIAAAARLAEARVCELVTEIAQNVGRLPQSEAEFALDAALARAAVRLAVTRHCGTVETVYTVAGPVTVQHGKDLSHVDAVIGTGGAIVSSPDPRGVLETALADPAEPLSLKPTAPRLLLDADYLLYACGLLSTVEPQAALELALTNLRALDQEKPHERARCA